MKLSATLKFSIAFIFFYNVHTYIPQIFHLKEVQGFKNSISFRWMSIFEKSRIGYFHPSLSSQNLSSYYRFLCVQ